MNVLKPRIFKRRQDIPRGAAIVEALPQTLKELFVIRHPALKNAYSEKDAVFRNFVRAHRNADVWIYYPWSKKAVHTLSENLYFTLRTARNRNIITETEQLRYRNMAVGVAGLSVGSAILSALVMSGGPKRLKIADFDVVEISNLNRMRARLSEVGMSKAEVAARNIWDVDPFGSISLYAAGLNEHNLADFVLKRPRLNLFIDEMDSIPMKIRARQICRRHKIPVVMVTDNGNGVILDVERFDKEQKRPLLHGIMEGMNPDYVQNLDFKSWVRVANKIVGNKSLGTRMRQSISEIGKTISGMPQLGASAAMGGSCVAFVARSIANNQQMPSGRYRIEFEHMFLKKR